MTLRASVLLATLLTSQICYSELFPLPAPKCRQKISSRLRTWGATGEWRQLVSTQPGRQRFVSATRTFGSWVYWESEMGGPLKIALHSQYKMKLAEWSENCVEKFREEQLQRPADAYDDVYLAKLAAEKKNFLLVVWSPETAYMGKSLAQLMKLAKTNRLPVQFFLEGSAPIEEAKVLGRKFGLPSYYFRRLNSFELTMRHVRTHLPVVYQFRGGRLKPQEWRGYRSLAEYKELLAKSGVRR